jgi:hypothetical protein
MTTSGNGKNTAIIILVVILLLFAFRSIFFVLPFGIFPGMSHAFRDAGRAFGPLTFIPMLILPLALIALWVFVIVWVYQDAEKRRMSGILWALLVLIGNVIGLIISLIVRNESALRPQPPAAAPPAPVPAPAEPAASAAKGPGKCPDCGQDVESGFVFCPHCGAVLKPVCPSCRKPVDKSWKVCPNCGASLDAGKIEQA